MEQVLLPESRRRGIPNMGTSGYGSRRLQEYHAIGNAGDAISTKLQNVVLWQLPSPSGDP